MNNLSIATTFFRESADRLPHRLNNWLKTKRGRWCAQVSTYHIRLFTCNGVHHHHQLDHFLLRATDMKRVCKAGLAKTDLLHSDHRTIALTIRLASRLTKPRPSRPQPALSLLGTEIDDEGNQRPTQDTQDYLDRVTAGWTQANLDQNASIDTQLLACTKVLTEAAAGLPQKWRGHMFGANDPEVRHLREKLKALRKCRARNGLSDLRKRSLRTQICRAQRSLTLKRKDAENAAMAQLEPQIVTQGENGPAQTSGRREWAVRDALKRAGHKQRPRRLPNRLTDPATGREAVTIHQKHRLNKDYCTELYKPAHPANLEEVMQDCPTNDPGNELSNMLGKRTYQHGDKRGTGAHKEQSKSSRHRCVTLEIPALLPHGMRDDGSPSQRSARCIYWRHSM